MFKWFKNVLVVLCFAFYSFPVFASGRAILFRTGIQSGNVSRFVLETSSKPSYNIFYLNNPQRIVIDIDDIDISNVKKESSKTGFIDEVRLGEYDDDTARIVLDLTAFAKVKKDFILNPIGDNKNYRLVVDIESTSQTEFDKLSNTKSNNKTIVNEEEVEIEITSSSKNVSSSSKKVEVKTTTTTTTSKKSIKKDKKVIVIDAGHGGKDPGAIGIGGTKEKNIVLSMAKQLRDILKKNPNYKIVMTRDTDIFLPLAERSYIAEKNNADLFISIHADSSPKKTTKGFSIYTLSEKATDEESKKLAEKENASDLIGIGTFDSYDRITKNILGDLMQTQVKIASVEIADEIVKQVKQDVLCVDRPVREAPFMVLRSSVPSVLAEMGFLSNKDEEKKLNQKWYREKLAYSLSRAIDKILQE